MVEPLVDRCDPGQQYWAESEAWLVPASGDHRVRPLRRYIGAGSAWVLVEIKPRHEEHIHPILICEQQVSDQSASTAEGQLVDPTIRVVRVERLTALRHQFQYRQAEASATAPAGGSSRVWARATGSISSVYVMRSAVRDRVRP